MIMETAKNVAFQLGLLLIVRSSLRKQMKRKLEGQRERCPTDRPLQLFQHHLLSALVHVHPPAALDSFASWTIERRARQIVFCP
jgi:hypothetical protein